MSRHVDTKHNLKNGKAARGLEVIDEEDVVVEEEDVVVVEELKETKKESVAVIKSSSSLNLLTDAYKPATIKKYRGAVWSFLDWCREEGVESVNSFVELDNVLFDYV